MNCSSALFLTPIVPADALVRGSGVLRRFGLLVAGVSRIAASIDFVIQVDAWREADLERYTRESLAALAQLTERRVTVTLVPMAAPNTRPNRIRDVIATSFGLGRLPGYRPYLGQRQLDALRAALAQRPDFVFAQKLVSAAQLLELARFQRLPPIFFDLDDIEHVAYRRNLEQPPYWRSKRLGYLHLPALIAGEYAAIRLATRTLVCSELDRRRLWRWFRNARVMTLPNAVEIPAESPLPHRPRLLFLGIYSYRPNSAAAEFFLDRIWPRIRSNVADAEVVIAGAKPEAIRHYQAPPPGVTFPGFVPDLDQLYATTRVVVCPILAGGGTRVKILEAAAYARPIVSTPLGAEGLDLPDGRAIHLRAEAPAFADACIHLLQDHDAATRMGLAARAQVMDAYDREATAKRLGAIIEHALAENCVA